MKLSVNQNQRLVLKLISSSVTASLELEELASGIPKCLQNSLPQTFFIQSNKKMMILLKNIKTKFLFRLVLGKNYEKNSPISTNLVIQNPILRLRFTTNGLARF
jgi:hypothetical protein